MIRAILTDIEGTTSSLSFVHDVLFPYSLARMAEFVRTHRDDAAVQVQLDAVRAASDARSENEVIAMLLKWIAEDRKITPLKALQGMIWESGFRNGDFKGHVYDDAAQALRAWHARGLKLYVFSSGSVHAQKLLFGFSDHGDLAALFSGFFDTTIGAKRESAAYAAIAREIGLPPGEILFLSDIVQELDAARVAGMQAIQVIREGVTPQAVHPTAGDFRGIDRYLAGGKVGA
jgi:enolase-phosphatase E1